jgi:hypothetical protein
MSPRYFHFAITPTEKQKAARMVLAVNGTENHPKI